MTRPSTRLVLGVVAVVVLATGTAGSGYVIAHALRRPAARSAAPTPIPSIVAAATAAPSVPASPTGIPARAAGVAATLDRPLGDPRLGGRVLAEVADPATGAVLLGRDALTPAAPASTAKLATAVALLSVRAPTDRITTRAVAGAASGTVILVGGGDPTLSAAAAGTPTPYAGAARISDLAHQIRAAGVRATRVLVDGSLFTGPAVSPAWAAGDIPSSYAAPITATMVDGGRSGPHDRVRSTDPSAAAGRALAAALGVPGAAVGTGRAPVGARLIGAVESAPVSALVQQMLEQSDNVIAECLARQVAVARDATASFAGAAAQVRAVVAGGGVDIGPGMTDGSGLAATDRISPASLVSVLRLATAASGRPALTDVLAGLPVAAWSGTLTGRFLRSSAVGVVRAKTGTLTSVSALAGVVHDRDGRLLAFALVADRVGPTEKDTVAAESALDAVATALAGCGCG